MHGKLSLNILAKIGGTLTVMFFFISGSFSSFERVRKCGKTAVKTKTFSNLCKFKLAAKHILAKAWLLSFERFYAKIRDFLKNLLLIHS